MYEKVLKASSIAVEGDDNMPVRNGEESVVSFFDAVYSPNSKHNKEIKKKGYEIGGKTRILANEVKAYSSGGTASVEDFVYYVQHELLDAIKSSGEVQSLWYNRSIASFFEELESKEKDRVRQSLMPSLFFNYNWSSASLLSRSVDNAKKDGRNPIEFLYAGVNMQGGEPSNGINWTLLKDYPISIGLWGAHNQNMFWESRHEKGGAPDARQNTYQLRLERWFTGGSRNPANCPPITNNLKYNADNISHPGMSSMMSARSTLSWNLGEEPFVTYFNLGNGKFFNWMGERQHNGEWYNIGVQDYLPTWRWWVDNGDGKSVVAPAAPAVQALHF